VGAVRALFALALTLLAVWAALIAIMSLLESRLLFFPTKSLDATPPDFGLESEDLRLTTSDGVGLRGWWIRAAGIGPRSSARHVVLLFHGNAGNVSHRLERAKLFAERLGTDLFLVDWRGYGLSAGKPSESGLYRDGLAIYDAARERGFSPEQIVLLGESLGCPVALEVALRRPVSRVALETPFLSVPALARQHYPFVPSFLVRSRFDAESRIRRVTAPKLIVAAERDEIAPPSHARRLHEVAAEPKELYVVPGAGHNDVYSTGGGPYLLLWRRFLAR
jgi:uncharacterized protein